MNHLTIKIKDISDGKKEAFKASIIELKSTIYADTMAEIFKLVPEAIKTSKKYQLGTFGKASRKDHAKR